MSANRRFLCNVLLEVPKPGGGGGWVEILIRLSSDIIRPLLQKRTYILGRFQSPSTYSSLFLALKICLIKDNGVLKITVPRFLLSIYNI